MGWDGTIPWPCCARRPARPGPPFPYDELQLDSRLKDLQIALLRSGDKRRTVLTREEQAVQDLCRALFDALMAGEVRSLYDVSKAKIAEAGQGLRLKPCIASPSLAALSREYLGDAQWSCETHTLAG